MLARVCTLLDNKPTLRDVLRLGTPRVALAGDEAFLQCLWERALDAGQARRVLQKLAERRVYRPLMIVPGDRALALIGLDDEPTAEQRDHALRRLAAVVDSTWFRPFLLFVSASVEKRLRHAFDEGELAEYLGEVSQGDDNVLRQAMAARPARVVIWTTPYKQLYKDPALRVTVEGTVVQLDQMEYKRGSIPESVWRRVADAINDASGRYAALWRIYVFVSDGAFYAGTVAKLLANHGCAKNSVAHHKCLAEARDWLALALRAAYQFYTDSLGTNQQILLNEEVSLGDFRKLLKYYLALRAMPSKGTVPGVTTVNLESYVHGDEHETCRDMRYKYAAPAAHVERAKVERVLRALGVERSILGEFEYIDFADVLETTATEVEVMPEAARNDVRLERTVRLAFLEGLPRVGRWAL